MRLVIKQTFDFGLDIKGYKPMFLRKNRLSWAGSKGHVCKL